MPHIQFTGINPWLFSALSLVTALEESMIVDEEDDADADDLGRTDLANQIMSGSATLRTFQIQSPIRFEKYIGSLAFRSAS